MSGLTFEFHSDELKKQLEKVARRIGNKKMLRAAGSIVRESVRTNFARGGRPAKWKSLKSRQGQPLRKTGRLQNSITSQVQGNVVYVGTNVVYGAVHQFGAGKGSFGTFVERVKGHERTRGGKTYHVRPHSRKVRLPRGDIPARPFLMVQDEDVMEIKAVLADYIVEGEMKR